MSGVRAVTFAKNEHESEIHNETLGAIGVVRDDGERYDVIYGARDCAEGLSTFLNVPLEET